MILPSLPDNVDIKALTESSLPISVTYSIIYQSTLFEAFQFTSEFTLLLRVASTPRKGPGKSWSRTGQPSRLEGACKHATKDSRQLHI